MYVSLALHISVTHLKTLIAIRTATKALQTNHMQSEIDDLKHMLGKILAKTHYVATAMTTCGQRMEAVLLRCLAHPCGCSSHCSQNKSCMTLHTHDVRKDSSRGVMNTRAIIALGTTSLLHPPLMRAMRPYTLLLQHGTRKTRTMCTLELYRLMHSLH